MFPNESYFTQKVKKIGGWCVEWGLLIIFYNFLLSTMESWDYIRIQLLYSCIKDCRFSLLMLDNSELFPYLKELYDKTVCNWLQ